MEGLDKYRDKLLDGYLKSPELLTLLIARVFWTDGGEYEVKDMLKTINVIVGKENRMELCGDIAKKVLDYGTSGSKDD